MLEDEVPIEKICQYTGLAREKVLELTKRKSPPDKGLEPAADASKPSGRKPNKIPKAAKKPKPRPGG